MKTRKPKGNGGIACPPCKLLLNSGGLTGTLGAILEVRKSLNARGRDFSPGLYKKLTAVVCGAHKALVALETEIIEGDTVAIG